MSVIRVEGLYR